MKKIWMNGCFDVLHYGHFKLIEYASSFNGQIIIGIDSDDRVKALKGDDRPFHNQEQRRFNLLQIKGITDVIIFDTDDELRNQLKLYQPDIFVIGDDYMFKPIIGGEHAKEIKFFGKLNEFSTTKILSNE